MDNSLENSDAPTGDQDITPTDGLIEAYRGNPLTEAFGPIPDDDYWRALLTKDDPPYDPNDRWLPAHLRAHAAPIALSGVRVVTPVQLQIMHKVRELQMRGYLHRDIRSPEFRRRLREDRKVLMKGGQVPEHFAGVKRLGGVVSGFAGVGKTTLVDMAMDSLPECHRHRLTLSDGSILSCNQIFGAKVELFEDADLKDLAFEICSTVEGLSGDSGLWQTYGLNTCSETSVQPRIYALCRDYNLGMIKVDEVQNMVAHKDGYRKVLKYLVRLMNQCGVPVLVIGTPLIDGLISEDGAASRRLAGMPKIEPLRRNSEMLKKFLREIGRYEYSRQHTDLEALADVFYDATGGIPDLIIKLYTLAQVRMFGRKDKNGRPDETITKPVLLETADQLFWMVKGYVIEVQNGKKDASISAEERRRLNENCDQTLNATQAAVGAQPSAPNVPKRAPVEIASSVTKVVDDLAAVAGNPGEVSAVEDPVVAASKSEDPLAALEKLGLVEP
jgi:hypothetical protein